MAQIAALDQVFVVAQHGTNAQLESPPVLLLLSMQTLIAVWIFVLGTCFGSFLNVVIYRLPAGMSLGRPKSRCPRCETPLAARDNIPVLGWLLLRGKCRYCQLPIAARYPLIETTCGIIFLALMFGELLTGAANLPLRHPDHFHIHPGFWLVWFAKYDLSGIYLYHCSLLVLVLATAMIGYDGHPPVRRLTAFAVFAGLIPGIIWPDLRPVPAMPWSENIHKLSWGIEWSVPFLTAGQRHWIGVQLDGVLDGFIGALGGLLFARLSAGPLNLIAGSRPDDNQRAAVRHSIFLTAVFLGWQAAGMIVLLVLLLILPAKLLQRFHCEPFLRDRLSPGYFLMLFVFILLWEKLDSAVWMIGYDGWVWSGLTWWQDWLLTIAAMSAASLVANRLSETASPLQDSSTDHSASAASEQN